MAFPIGVVVVVIVFVFVVWANYYENDGSPWRRSLWNAFVIVINVTILVGYSVGCAFMIMTEYKLPMGLRVYACVVTLAIFALSGSFLYRACKRTRSVTRYSAIAHETSNTNWESLCACQLLLDTDTYAPVEWALPRSEFQQPSLTVPTTSHIDPPLLNIKLFTNRFSLLYLERCPLFTPLKGVIAEYVVDTILFRGTGFYSNQVNYTGFYAIQSKAFVRTISKRHYYQFQYMLSDTETTTMIARPGIIDDSLYRISRHDAPILVLENKKSM